MFNTKLIGLSSEFYSNTSLFSLFCSSNIVKNTRHIDINDKSDIDINYGDATNSYIVNSYGYRSPHFAENTDLVSLGCSQTFGVGIPAESVWSSLIASELGLSYANLATPGWSVQAMVQNFFSYCSKYGNPKIVTALLPDPYRMVLPVNSDFISYESNRSSNAIYIEDAYLFNGTTKAAKFSERPHKADHVIPPELPFYISMQMLHILIQYCKSSNIQLLWGTWHAGFNNMFRLKDSLNINEDFYGYIDIDIKEFNLSSCHLDLLSQYGDNFYHGLDCRPDKAAPSLDTSHLGIHAHRHIADKFIEHLV